MAWKVMVPPQLYRHLAFLGRLQKSPASVTRAGAVDLVRPSAEFWQHRPLMKRNKRLPSGEVSENFRTGRRRTASGSGVN